MAPRRDGRFLNPWPTYQEPGPADFARWQWERLTRKLPLNPTAAELPWATPAVAEPHAPRGELRATWIGHSTWLLQVGGFNLLTDPHWSERASPISWAGPRRFVPPGLPFDRLPSIDAILVSHDHYDHLDAATVDRLHERLDSAVRWFTPLGYSGWFRRRGISVVEMDWWESRALREEGESPRITCFPAQHWTSRSPAERRKRLWCSWGVASTSHRLYFGGDSGWFPEYQAIGAQAGPLDLVLLPIGAYEPRWFMRSSHMNPEEAVAAHRELGAGGIFAAMHWGTFRLTDEDPLEPASRIRDAWRDAGLPERGLWVPAHGETRILKTV